VRTGALALVGAGHPGGKRGTTHHRTLDLLRPLCRKGVRDRRIVEEGSVVTAAGVASALDAGLSLVERFRGVTARGDRGADGVPGLLGALRSSGEAARAPKDEDAGQPQEWRRRERD